VVIHGRSGERGIAAFQQAKRLYGEILMDKLLVGEQTRLDGELKNDHCNDA